MSTNATQMIENAPLRIEGCLPPAERSDALGIIAKSVAKSSFPGSGLGLIAHETVHKSIAQARTEELVIQAKSDRWELKKAVETLFPGSRTAACCKAILPKHKDRKGGWVNESSGVSIYRSKENGSTFYGGLETCSSVWICPICGAKISERRRYELITMQNIWKAEGGVFRFLTLTFPHGSNDVLADLLTNFSKARKRLFQSRSWREWSSRIGLTHTIYCLEVTHGVENGWHIHLHCVLFIMPTADSQEPQASDIFSAWQRACALSGLGEPNLHGVDIRDGEAAANYITKWGLDLELTKQHTKHGREGHSTPFDLLRRYVDGDDNAGSLFKEFACAFKGKRHIIVSRGLRRALGMGPEKTDEELAQEKLDKADCIAVLTVREWTLVLKYNFRFGLLEEARLHGLQRVRQCLQVLSSA